MNILLDVASGKNLEKTPIWLMRQAGRYLPEYREIRKKAGSFLDLCFNPELASEVTLQPIKRFDFDAAIIFSDILIVPKILGLNLEFIQNEGPKLETIREERDLSKLNIKSKNESEEIKKLCETLEITREKLPNSKTLIGFAGSPWTVATYIISDKKHDFEFCRKFAYEKQNFLEKLIEILTNQTIIYLKAQIDSGAQIIQLFDSWSGILCEEEFEKLVINPTQKIVSEIRKYSKEIKIIAFPKGAGNLYKKYADLVKPDVLSIDQFIPLDFAKELQENVVVQGNLDPLILLQDKYIIKKKIDNIMEKLSNKSFIFNLGHGIMQHTPPENVKFLVDYVRNWRK